MENWVSVYSTDKVYLAEIAKELLFENGIHAVVINKKDSTYHFGVIELHVKQEYVVRGKHILREIDESASDN